MKSPAVTQNTRRSAPAVRARRGRHGAFHDPSRWKLRFYSCGHDTSVSRLKYALLVSILFVCCVRWLRASSC
jgi:hypothetical protein